MYRDLTGKEMIEREKRKRKRKTRREKKGRSDDRKRRKKRMTNEPHGKKDAICHFEMTDGKFPHETKGREGKGKPFESETEKEK
jgi:hypothetical protein